MGAGEGGGGRGARGGPGGAADGGRGGPGGGPGVAGVPRGVVRGHGVLGVHLGGDVGPAGARVTRGEPAGAGPVVDHVCAVPGGLGGLDGSFPECGAGPRGERPGEGVVRGAVRGGHGVGGEQWHVPVQRPAGGRPGGARCGTLARGALVLLQHRHVRVDRPHDLRGQPEAHLHE